MISNQLPDISNQKPETRNQEPETRNQEPATRNQKPETSSAGIYIHIPFCVKKCPYCDFYSITDPSLKKAFVKALKAEISMSGNAPFIFDTIYFGGGTPSVLKADFITRIVEAASTSFSMAPYPEITMEINPGTVSPVSLKSFRQSGINRINIGVQSFQDNILKFLGRIHSAKEAGSAIKWARSAGFENLGIDLIYGIPGQTKESWLCDLETALRFEPEHLSCYMLTYESGTQIHKDLKNGNFSSLPESVAASLFGSTGDFLGKNGYIHYEISNFALSEDKKSRHNIKYWAFAPYIGLGPSAHSFYGTKRSWNCRSVKDYINDIDSGIMPVEGEEELSRKQQIIESVFLGLRQIKGIDIKLFDSKFDTGFIDIFSDTITGLNKKGLLFLDENRCALTKKGMLLLDTICSEFILNEF